ncbi:MAG: hypothetical protein CBD16_05475 [Betaproteobacteria bacterium TMED156]|nr:MAG: hypothetical protein CBD16_05475 [Betaproteobacteria bacterium TMED156]
MKNVRQSSQINKKTQPLIFNFLFFCLLFVASHQIFAASYEFSLYGGFNNAAHSSVNFSGASSSYGVTDGKYSTDGWEGESFESPIYYGYRLSYIFSEDSLFEFAIDFNHSKVKAKSLPAGLKRLEFTDGINTLTGIIIYKVDKIFENDFEIKPYVGFGIGLAYPHVDVESNSAKTYDYQHTGAAYQILAGAKYQLSDSWKTFAEYRLTYTPIEADLDGGGKIETDILNNQVSVGIVYSF